MHYIPGSKLLDSNNNIISFSFYLDKLEDSIPYNYDSQGTYNYKLYRFDTSNFNYIELNTNEANWILDNDTGLF